jgi:hypothetical protein
LVRTNINIPLGRFPLNLYPVLTATIAEIFRLCIGAASRLIRPTLSITTMGVICLTGQFQLCLDPTGTGLDSDEVSRYSTPHKPILPFEA